MNIIKLARAKHLFAGCPCAHAEHVGKVAYLADQAPVQVIRCRECESIEQRENVVIAVEPEYRVARLSLIIGTPVRCGDVPYRVASIEQITKLGGAIVTGYARVKLRAVA
jgi:hypothetical protein